MMAYFIQSNLTLLLLFSVYAILLRNSKLFVFNRFYLLGALVLSLISPLLPLGLYFVDSTALTSYIALPNIAEQIASIEYKTLGFGTLKSAPTYRINFWLLAYCLVGFVFLMRLVANLYQLFRLSKRKGPIIYGMQSIYISEQSNPFSFFNFLFVNEKEFVKLIQNDAIIWHEKAHCKQKHSIDLLFVSLVQVFFWCNPILMAYKWAIQNNHEFLADDYASKKQKNSHHYLLELMAFIKRKNTRNLLGSSFAYKNIKKRIEIIQKQKPSTMKKISTISLSICAALSFLTICSFGTKSNPITLSTHTEMLRENTNTPSILPIEKDKITKISSHFGMRYHPFSKSQKMHSGVDIVAPKGTPILATANGVVNYADFSEGFGNHIKIQHDNAYQTMYAHLENIQVKNGDVVKKGDVIGIIGNTGKSKSTHLHYEVKKGGEKVNPTDYFQYEILNK